MVRRRPARCPPAHDHPRPRDRDARRRPGDDVHDHAGRPRLDRGHGRRRRQPATARRGTGRRAGGMTVSGDVRDVPPWGPTVARWTSRMVLLAALWCVVAMVLTPFAHRAV